MRLTPREAAILASVERGESVKQTARALGIAMKTVENLQSRMFRKLGARNRAHAVTIAHRLGLLGDVAVEAGLEPVGAVGA
jgi:DNA-binding CsgD family transcriptional regulator